MRRFTAGALALACLLGVVACDSGSDSASTDRGETKVSHACDEAAKAGVKPSKHLVQCLAPSVVLIETAGSNAGSGLVIQAGAKQYVVTNLHVVDPEPKVDVVVTGDKPKHLDDVPVVGVDKTADIAVLGPVKTGRDPVSLAEPTTEKGDDVYLVGYPGETEEEPEVTISSGIVSRLRTDKVFDLSYVQTDASIAGGQSGGALADEAGRVIGVSGSSIGDDKFALALDGDDVQAAVDRILAGTGDDYWTFPSDDPEAGTTSGDVHLRSADDGLALYVSTDEATTLEMTVGPASDVGIAVNDYDTGDNIFTDRAALQKTLELAGDQTDPALIEQQIEQAGLKMGDAVSPGKYRVDLPADTRIEIDLGYVGTGEVDVTWSSNLPLLQEEDDEVDVPLTLAEPHTGLLDAGEREASFTIDLQGGTDYQVGVASSASDPGVVILAAGQPYAEGWTADDSDVGLYGTDVDETFTPDADGTFTVLVENYSGYAMAYRLTIAAAKED